MRTCVAGVDDLRGATAAKYRRLAPNCPRSSSVSGGVSPPPIKDNSFRGGDGASNRDGATRALVPVAVALLSLGCKEAPGRRPLPATWLKKSHFAGGERQLQALLRSVPADDHVPVAQNAADVTVARVCVCAGRTAGRN